jgi:enterochelin esterase-like enzyme
MLADGDVPPIDQGGNFVVGPTHEPAPELADGQDVPKGTIHSLVMTSDDSAIYPGIARDDGTFGTPDPDNPARLIVTTCFPKPWRRTITVYVPAEYPANTPMPFVIGTDGPDPTLFKALDNLIHDGRLPPMIGISIGNGGGDAQGSQRGLEYDTMNGVYAEFVETEILPRVETQCDVQLTRDPEERIAMGCSSGAACALIMAWYHPDLYRRVLSFSGTYVNQQWPYNPETPGGAWEFHNSIIPEAPRKPLRIWLAVADRDLYNPNVMRDDMHDWVLANQKMAKVLAEKGYPYQFTFVRNAWHCDPAMRTQLLPQALEWLWQGVESEASQG